ncbi:MAG TPA: hypothetical protein VF201_13720 [Nitrolancea sp.]
MRAEAAVMLDTGAALPIEMRASLDLLFELLAGERGVIRTSAIGKPSLISALAAYGTIEPSRDHSTFLGASVSEIGLNIGRNQPQQITVLGSGRLQHVIGPLRRSVDLIPRVPAGGWWKHRGYQLIRSIKVQGAGSLFWSSCDRLLRRVDRPQLADRCRIAMLRTLIAARWSTAPATLLIQEFRRAA